MAIPAEQADGTSWNTQSSWMARGKFTGGNVDIPVVGAISLLTGINEDATLDEILSHLK